MNRFENNGKPWTQEDINYLTERYPVAQLSELVEALKRSRRAIKLKASGMGLKRAVRDRSTGGHYHGWTDRELAYMHKYYPIHSNAQIAEATGRTIISVAQRAFKMGLRKDWGAVERARREGYNLEMLATTGRNRWTTEEIDFLTQNYQTMTHTEIAKRLGRSRKAVAARVQAWGLRKKVEQFKTNNNE